MSSPVPLTDSKSAWLKGFAQLCSLAETRPIPRMLSQDAWAEEEEMHREVEAMNRVEAEAAEAAQPDEPSPAEPAAGANEAIVAELAVAAAPPQFVPRAAIDAECHLLLAERDLDETTIGGIRHELVPSLSCCVGTTMPSFSKPSEIQVVGRHDIVK